MNTWFLVPEYGRRLGRASFGIFGHKSASFFLLKAKKGRSLIPKTPALYGVILHFLILTVAKIYGVLVLFPDAAHDIRHPILDLFLYALDALLLFIGQVEASIQCVGAASAFIISQYLVERGLTTDISRLAAQVISGIGFLGAGMIIIKGSNIITGLTTAAGMWTTAAIGIALGYGFYSASVIGMLACLFTAHFLTKLERKRKMSHPIYIEVDDPKKSGDICSQIRVLTDNDMALEVAPAKSGIAGHLALYVTLSNTKKFPEIIETIKDLDGVSFVIVE